MRLVREDGRVVCERCVVADTAATRMKGLLGRAGLDEGEGLLIKPAGSIHMFFMRFPIDAVFLDRELRVVNKLWRQVENRWMHRHIGQWHHYECSRHKELGRLAPFAPSALTIALLRHDR